MPYCRLFYHFVWSTKKREQWITAEIEPILTGAIKAKAIGLGGRVFAVNACRDHVHLVASVPPKAAVSKFIGEIKGISSLRINQAAILPSSFSWQEEYSVFTFEACALARVVAYVENQKSHHAEV